MNQRIYLDNAATSWPKPQAVINAINNFYQELGSASGRGIESSGYSSDQIVRKCRHELKQFLNASADDELIFSNNGTDAINIALFGLLEPNSHVITSVLEHNSVLRPLNLLESKDSVRVSVICCAADGQLSVDELAKVITPETSLVCVTHASNVTGEVQRLDEIAEVCARTNTALMIDAAQTVGHTVVDFAQLQCDLLVAPGHKGLMGPLGTGFLLISERIKDRMKCWRVGGTGSQSELTSQPMEYPDRLEAGNLNVGGIAGLLAGLEFVRNVGLDSVSEHEQQLTDRVLELLSQSEHIDVFTKQEARRTGVVSFAIPGVDPREIGTILESSFGIQTRSGLHCAPKTHQYLGTFESGGLIRASVGYFNRIEDVELFGNAVLELAETLVG